MIDARVDLRSLYSHRQDMIINITAENFLPPPPFVFPSPPALSSLRCASGQGADAHGRGDLSHAAPARGSAPPPVRLRPAVCRLLPSGLLHRISASSASQCLLQWDNWPSAPLLQPGETIKGGLCVDYQQSSARCYQVVSLCRCRKAQVMTRCS